MGNINENFISTENTPVPNAQDRRHIWLGLVNDKTWESTGKEAVYYNWGKNQPNNINEKREDKKREENCTIMQSAKAFWHDFSCSDRFPFICEKDRN